MTARPPTAAFFHPHPHPSHPQSSHYHPQHHQIMQQQQHPIQHPYQLQQQGQQHRVMSASSSTSSFNANNMQNNTQPPTQSATIPHNILEPVDIELQSARCLFGEKVKELSVAVAKVDALTRQLEELQRGNTSNSYHVVSTAPNNGVKLKQEYEKLRQDLLYRNELMSDQDADLAFKRSLLNQKKNELVQLDQRIMELQSRLSRKRMLNQQQRQAQSAMLASKSSQQTVHPLKYSSLRHSLGPGYFSLKRPLPPHFRPNMGQINVAAVEPMQRVPVSSSPSSSTSTTGGLPPDNLQVSHLHCISSRLE